MAIYNLPVERVCVENPRGHPYIAFRKPDQVIEPYYFGDKNRKRTCLWIRGLPCLYHTEQDTLVGVERTHVEPPKPVRLDGEHTTQPGKARYYTDKHEGRSAHSRARFWPGIAAAMADQWGSLAPAPSQPAKQPEVAGGGGAP